MAENRAGPSFGVGAEKMATPAGRTRMIRSFVALTLPQDIRSALVLTQMALPLPRRVAPENLHLTLAFLGELSNPVLDEVHAALSDLRAPAFDLRLRGLGLFGGKRPRNLHAGVAPEPALEHLQAKVAQAARRAGVTLEARRFVPHVTLSRFSPEAADLPRLEQAVAAAGLFSAGPFRVDHFALMRSWLRQPEPEYDVLAEYPLLP